MRIIDLHESYDPYGIEMAKDRFYEKRWDAFPVYDFGDYRLSREVRDLMMVTESRGGEGLLLAMLEEITEGGYEETPMAGSI